MTDQLTVYNLALLMLGERRISALGEAREPRRVLDDFWPTVTSYCLAQGMWAFAMKGSAALAPTAAGYGFTHAWTKPTDIVHLAVMSDQVGLFPQIDRDYLVIGSAIYTNTAALYLKYTSNAGSGGGMDLTLWTDSFTNYVAAALARAACVRVTGSLESLPLFRQAEDEFYLAAFAQESVSMWQGLLPFNAAARAPSASEALEVGQDVIGMSFAAYRGAMARLSAGGNRAGAGG